MVERLSCWHTCWCWPSSLVCWASRLGNTAELGLPYRRCDSDLSSNLQEATSGTKKTKIKSPNLSDHCSCLGRHMFINGSDWSAPKPKHQAKPSPKSHPSQTKIFTSFPQILHEVVFYTKGSRRRISRLMLSRIRGTSLQGSGARVPGRSHHSLDLSLMQASGIQTMHKPCSVLSSLRPLYIHSMSLKVHRSKC